MHRPFFQFCEVALNSGSFTPRSCGTGVAVASINSSQITKKKDGMTMAEKKERETKAVAPWRPFMGLSHWERDMDRMMEEFFGKRMRPWWPERWSKGDEMEAKPPIVDVFEEKDDIVVKAELPGIEKDNIEVNLADHTLTIKGEKKKRKKSKKRTIIVPSVRTEAFSGP
jgi:HSP20 family molecular chaperone IbpA